MLAIRKAVPADAEVLCDLYGNHLNPQQDKTSQDMTAWREKIGRFHENPYHHLLVGEMDGRIVSAVTLVVIENLTRHLRPYAIMENVVTHTDFRGRGFAAALMNHASDIAARLSCYKIMLLTGRKSNHILKFYEKCGYNKNDKTGFIKWL